MPALEMSALSYTYLRGSPMESPALHDVTLRVERGEIVALMGETGAGKSTLLQFGNALLRPAAAGVVRVLDTDTAVSGDSLRGLRLRAGLLQQRAESQLLEEFVGDDIAFGPRQLGLPLDEVRQRVREAMADVGLDFDGFKDRRSFTLSGGEMKRVAIAGLLALRPELYLLDEPTGGLDPEARLALLDVVVRLRQSGATVVMATTNVEDVPGVADRVVVMRQGRIVGEVPTVDLWRQATFLRENSLELPEIGLIVEALRRRWPIEPTTLLPEDVADCICKTLLTCDI
ncbi:MAG: ATP-binding cassette domain-containing protein [Anaerolineae bacterium]